MLTNDLNLIDAFIREAKAATYAGNGPKSPERSYNKSEDLLYKHNGFSYHDRYWGAAAFIGSEMIWRDLHPVWGMNYYGGPVAGYIDVTPAYDFLKLALQAGTADKTIPPARGPREFAQGPYLYKNQIDGDLARFTGQEDIFKDGIVVCRHIYHGGLVF